MKTCKELMTTDPMCCLPSDTVQEAARLMKRGDVGPVPVVATHDMKELIGIVTDRDLALRVVAAGRDPKTTKVEEVMTRDLVTCRPEEDVHRALDVMAEHQVRRVPVVDDNGIIVGIIAQADIATRMDEPERTAEVVSEISEPERSA